MKRRSATSSPPERIFFADENLGRLKLPGLLREAGVDVRPHRPPFIAKVLAGGRVKMWLDWKDWREARARRRERPDT